ncbi:hypothetical protein Pyn_38996 [Prunus yedoensis var. nudiflora]|uniref:Uncharacterized protein n=1 Tax=Prunus yedoensis var. nudiflora TaxID=2094558 RepID=A0A314Z6R7_PRUYE|nr:hypothetical protein Pyn_38996 [Prunus yedoensis var. nudiflora]
MENDCFTKDDDDEGTAQRQGSKTMAAQIEPHQMNETSSICKRQEENLLTHNDLEKPSIASAALLPAAHGNEHLFLSKANVGNCVKTNINMDNNCSKEHVLEKVGDGSMAELPEKSSPKLEETNDGLEKLEREDKTVQTDKHDRYTNLTKTRRFLDKEGKKGAPLMKYNHARLC